jgi:NAD(P)-dependent dehydrogenase (short-subunit alcohol dehydrogenase family)
MQMLGHKLINESKMKQITLITGAGRGIGKEIALKFASENHDLILLVLKMKQKNELNKIFKKKKINCKIFVGDLKNIKFINSLSLKIKKINNLVNNAALANTKHFTKVSNRELTDLIDVNLKAPFLLSQIFAKKMIKNKIKGSIIHVSSQLGHTGAYNRSIYCMSKFGLEGLNKSIAMDLGRYGIRSVTVAPTKTIVNQVERIKTKKRLNIIKKKIPLRKFSTTKQIANIVFFLTTDKSVSITGSSILSDGGWTAGK